jgi:hypothetical protein
MTLLGGRCDSALDRHAKPSPTHALAFDSRKPGRVRGTA